MKHSWNVGITTKLVWILVFFSLIPLSVQVYSLFETAQVLEKEVGVQYQYVAEGLAETLHHHLTERYADAQTMSRNRVLYDRTLWYQRGSDMNDIAATLNEYVQTSGMYYLIQVVDLNGQLIAVNDRDAEGQSIPTEGLYEQNFGSTPWFQALRKKISGSTSGDRSSKGTVAQHVFVEEVSVDRDVKAIFPKESGLTIGLSVPIYDHGEIVGYWSQRMKYSMVETIFQHSYQGLKKAGFPHAELSLHNGQGFTILEYAPAVHHQEEVIHDLDNVLFKTNLAQLGIEAAQSAVQGKSGFTTGDYHPGKQGMQVIGFSHLQEGEGFQGLHWSMLVQVPEEEAFSQVQDKTNKTLAEMLVGLLIVFPIGIFMGRKVVSRLKPFWEVAAKASEGDLTPRVPVTTQDELGQMGNALNNLLDQLNRMLLQTRAVAHALSKSSDQLSAVGHQVFQTSQSQVHQATQVAASVEEMSSTAVNMARNTQDLASTAKDVNESAVRGGEIVSSSIQGMESVSSRMQDSAGRIQNLGQRSKEIGDIIGVIEDIAEQTNLLALNAAIEAARAGDQGRGFAVVADEVRKLAERTGKATKEIATVIESVQGGTHEAVRSMEAGTQEVHTGMTLAREAGIRLTEIVKGVQRVVDMIQHFAGSTQQQSEVSGQISSSIQQVAQLSQENETHVQGVAKATQQFAELAADLQTSLSRFTLK
ncbi:MAG: methyl-accepting chemotaxis protein [Nitrospirales bacterium]